jgi:type IV secretory pathway TraG/TraD family ATPase VirD4
VIFGPGGSGKQRAGTLPICCTWPHSLICIDVKREHVHVTQESRGRFGPSYVVDPFGRVLKVEMMDEIRRLTAVK